MENVPPPIIESEPLYPSRRYWTWFIFAGLALFMVITNLFSIFAMGEKGEDVLSNELMSAPIALKQYVVLNKAAEFPGMEPLKSQADSALEASESAFRAKLDQSEEAAAWLLTLETIQGKELTEKALDKLQLSEDEDMTALGLSFEGIDGKQVVKGDDYPQIVARWRMDHIGEKEFPVDELGINANPAVYFGFIFWMVAIVGGGIITLLVYTVVKANGGLPALGYQEGISLLGADARGGRMAIYFTVFIGLQIVAGVPMIFKMEVDPVATMAGVMLTMILLIPILTTFPLFDDRIKFGKVIGDRKGLFKKFAWGFGGYMVNFPLAFGATLLMSPLQQYLPTPSHELLEMIDGSSTTTALLLFFIAAIAAPLVEEPMFRGVLFPALQRILKTPTAAIVLTGVIFAVIHPQGPLLWPALACVGMTAAVLTRQTGSILPAILMHFLHNATIYGLNVVLR